jgi:hypothetical protein
MESFQALGLVVKDLGTEFGAPYLIIDHLTYPNVEAHLFTAADVAGWVPEILDTDNVKITCCRNAYPNQERDNWDSLLKSLQTILSLLKPFRDRVRKSGFSSVIWSHEFRGWHRSCWEGVIHPVQNPDRFIHYVDESIREHIVRLNELGFGTLESCSGLPEDHSDREPYWPYLMFDERTYPGIAPHLFTLANIAGWIPTMAPHNFDVYVKMRRGEDIRDAWRRLVRSAHVLGGMLKDYQNAVLSSRRFSKHRSARPVSMDP